MDKAIGFVNAHMGKSMLDKAQSKEGTIYLYIFNPDHPSYHKFEQMWGREGIPGGNMAFFAKCKSAVPVGPSVPGLKVLAITFPSGDLRDPVVTDIWGNCPAPLRKRARIE